MGTYFAIDPCFKDIPKAFITPSKVRSCINVKQGKQHSDGYLYFPPDEAMDNAEYELGKDLGKQLIREE